ncbi:MAG: glycosyltransferase family 39 protein [Planctomycetes bacterium]|nr:glycosyltransferase family 39 protein [Planctomycetota bacterium]
MNGDARTRRGGLLLWLGAWLCFVCVAHGNFESTDAGFTMHAARNLWLRGDSGLRTAAQGGELEGEKIGAFVIADSQRREEQGLGARVDGKLGQNGLAYVWFPIGYTYLMVPFVPLAAGVERALPDADRRLTQKAAGFVPTVVEGTPAVLQGLVALLLPSLCLATSLWLLFRIARELGADRRGALWTAAGIGVASQAFALGREQLSDGPGLTLLLLALWPVVRLHLAAPGARGAVRDALLAGAASGAAVLVRYQSALAILAFAAVLALAARRRGRYRELLAFAVGGAPFLVVLLAVDHARFGNPLDTGYTSAADWLNQPWYLGVLKMLFAAGRGALWLSPLLWLGLPLACSRRRLALRWLAWVLLLTPVALFCKANGWQGGQCWGVRYITPGVVGLLAIVLPQVAPWRRWPRLWRALFACGCLVSLTSVVAPVRGVLQLGRQAYTAATERALADGALSRDEATALLNAADDRMSWQPRYSPLWSNWRYAAQCWNGAFEDRQQHVVRDGAATIGAVFGVEPVQPEQGVGPLHWTDRQGRHLWWRFWADLYGVSSWLLLTPVALLAVLALWRGWRSLAASDFTTTSPDG